MKKLIHFLNWDMKNEFLASGYFTAMLFIYIILKLIMGEWNVDVLVVIEMFIINYVLATINRFLLDDDRDYRPAEFVIRGVTINVIAVTSVVIVSICCNWFEGMPVWSAFILYAMIIIAYITVWVLKILDKKDDTDNLNQQLNKLKEGEDQ